MFLNDFLVVVPKQFCLFRGANVVMRHPRGRTIYERERSKFTCFFEPASVRYRHVNLPWLLVPHSPEPLRIRDVTKDEFLQSMPFLMFSNDFHAVPKNSRTTMGHIPASPQPTAARVVILGAQTRPSIEVKQQSGCFHSIVGHFLTPKRQRGHFNSAFGVVRDP